MLQQLTLDKLRDGHEAVRSLNVRQVGRDEGIEALAASIAHHGLLAALVVAPIDPSIEDSEAYVIDGNRRLAALRLLAERGTWPADRPIPVMSPELPPVENEIVSVNEISLAANVMRVAMHPADAFEAYAKLLVDGLSVEQIAERFGHPIGEVRKALALGHVAPAVLAAWRAGEIDAKAVQAFTLAADDRQAEKILAAARKKGGYFLRSDSIRQALGTTDWKVKRALALVGLDAYRAAGGRVAEDLFDGDHLIADPSIAVSLAQQKLQAECHRLVSPAPDGEGWAWASVADDLPDTRWSWRHVESEGKPTKEERARVKEIAAELKRLEEIEERDGTMSDADDERYQSIENERAAIDEAVRDRGFDAAMRAKSGCILSLENDGTIRIDYGVVRPGDKKPKGAGAGKAEKKKKVERSDPFAVSKALDERLAKSLTRAVGDALIASPRVALAALVAGMAGEGSGPVEIKLDGLGAREAKRDEDREEFEPLFVRLCKMPVEDLLKAAAPWIARTLDIGQYREAIDKPPYEEEGTAALIVALDDDALRNALRARFDPADYFASVPKATLLAAIEQAMPGDQAAALKSKPRAEIEKFATTYVTATGWLPPALCPVPLELVEGKAAPTETLDAKSAKASGRKRAQAPARETKPKAKAKAKGARKRATPRSVAADRDKPKRRAA